MHTISIQVLQLRKKKLIFERNEIQSSLCELSDTLDLTKELQKCQQSFYKIQMEIYKNILDAILEKEKLLQLRRKQLPEEILDNRFDPPAFNFNLENENNDDADDEENDEFYDCDDGTNNVKDVIASSENRELDTSHNQTISDDYNNNKTNENKDSDDDDEEENDFHDASGRQSPLMSTSFFVKSTSGKKVVNKWESRRVIAIQESEDAKKKREILSSLNSLYRKRAWVRNRQVGICDFFVPLYGIPTPYSGRIRGRQTALLCWFICFFVAKVFEGMETKERFKKRNRRKLQTTSRYSFGRCNILEEDLEN